MGDDSEHDIWKTFLSNTPVKALNHDCRNILSKNLDIKQSIPSKSSHYPRDFRGLAELMGLPHSDSKIFETYKDPTLKILDSRPNTMLGDLIDYLEKIQRLDVIKDLKPLLDEQAKIFQQFQKDTAISVKVSREEKAEAGSLNQRVQGIFISDNKASSHSVRSEDNRNILTCQDITTGESTLYDAYVCYADNDNAFVQDLASFLESQEIGLKLFIRSRDMLAGFSELDTNIQLIKNRCRRMLIILTENFIHSSQCAFQISFATSLSIEQKERILVPILISPCDIPSVLLNVSKIDFTQSNIYEWMWQRLIMSLLPQKRTYVPSKVQLPAQPYQSPNPEPVTTSKTSPVITFPETVKFSSMPVNKTSAGLTSFMNSAESSSILSVDNQSEDGLVEPKYLMNDSASAKVVTAEDSPVIAVMEGLDQSLAESSAETKSSGASAKPSHVVSEKIPVTTKIRNAFRSYFRKESSMSSSSSLSSNVTSGYHSESTFLTN